MEYTGNYIRNEQACNTAFHSNVNTAILFYTYKHVSNCRERGTISNINPVSSIVTKGERFHILTRFHQL